MNAIEWADRRSHREGDDYNSRYAEDDPIERHENAAAIAGAICAIENGGGVSGGRAALAILIDCPSGRRFLHARETA